MSQNKRYLSKPSEKKCGLRIYKQRADCHKPWSRIRRKDQQMSVIDQASISVIKAQSGDHGIREQLISEHMAFIRRTVRHLTHAVFVEQMDEFSIALSAFNEAIDRYQDESQVPFEQYARILTKHLLTAWYRSNKSLILKYSLTHQ